MNRFVIIVFRCNIDQTDELFLGVFLRIDAQFFVNPTNPSCITLLVMVVANGSQIPLLV